MISASELTLTILIIFSVLILIIRLISCFFNNDENDNHKYNKFSDRQINV